MGKVPFGVAPTKPLEEKEEKLAYQRELHTVTVGMFRVFTAHLGIFLLKERHPHTTVRWVVLPCFCSIGFSTQKVTEAS